MCIAWKKTTALLTLKTLAGSSIHWGFGAEYTLLWQKPSVERSRTRTARVYHIGWARTPWTHHAALYPWGNLQGGQSGNGIRYKHPPEEYAGFLMKHAQKKYEQSWIHIGCPEISSKDQPQMPEYLNKYCRGRILKDLFKWGYTKKILTFGLRMCKMYPTAHRRLWSTIVWTSFGMPVLTKPSMWLILYPFESALRNIWRSSVMPIVSP